MTILRNCLALNPKTLFPQFGDHARQDIGENEIRRWGRLHRYNDFVTRTVIEVEGGEVFIVSAEFQEESVIKALRAASRKRKYQPLGGEARSRSDFVQWEA